MACGREGIVTGRYCTVAVVAYVVSIAVVLGLLYAIDYTYHDYGDDAQVYLARSVPFVGSEVPRLDGIDGTGIMVAVIDTGVDFEHPDMLGWGEDGKVAGGYNLLWRGGSLPTDLNGHGTQVAGVIAADGSLQGVAPKSKILAYKVSEDGSGVSSELIARAIGMAAADGADIINISLGINKTNPVIEEAIDRVVSDGILVVVAAGNTGPEPFTIGSPGRNHGALTVGATYNNLTSSLVATLQIEDKSYIVIPMADSPSLSMPVMSDVVFAGYAKAEDFEDLDVDGAIVIVERGSDVEDEMLYFSLKERNAADAGAAALIVYNNVPGMFLGELVHEFIEPGYAPRIPVVSIGYEDGVEIRYNATRPGSVMDASLNLFHNPDFVVHFSSRGPVSPFYIKPDLVAPGAYINTTQPISSHNITSGTSYSAPHVSGAAALLLHGKPDLDLYEIKSILMTTAEPVADAHGNLFSVHAAGSGRLDIADAHRADLAVMPPSLVVITSSQERSAEAHLEMRPVGSAHEVGDIDVSFDVPADVLEYGHVRMADDLLAVRLAVLEPSVGGEEDAPYGEHEGRIIITHNEVEYVVPFLLHYTAGSIDAALGEDVDGHRHLSFDVGHPDGWGFAKIDVIYAATGEAITATSTPGSTGSAQVEVFRDGLYWVEAQIMVENRTYSAYDTIYVGEPDEGGHVSVAYPPIPTVGDMSKSTFSPLAELPLRQVLIAAGVVGVVGVVGVAVGVRKRRVPAGH